VRVLVDENLPPALARSLRELFKGEHEIVHLREKFGSAVTDIEWINALSTDGPWIVISGDRRITRNRAEQSVFRNSKLIGFFLSSGLKKAKAIKQLERILALWANIETLSGTVQGGAMFELQLKSTKVQQLK
jgi:hypothetical protein